MGLGLRRVVAAVAVAAGLGGVLTPSAAGASSPVGLAAPAAVAAAPTDLTLSASPSLVTYGHSVTLEGRLTHRSVPEQPAAGAEVLLERRKAGAATWTLADTGTADPDGRVAFRRAPDGSGHYRLRHVGSATTDPAVSEAAEVSVRHLLVTTDPPVASRVGKTVTIGGWVGPDHPGRMVRLERKVSGSWTKVAVKPLRHDSSFAFTVKPSSAGWRRYRVVMQADGSHLAAVVTLPRLDVYRLHRYVVRTRGDIRADMSVFRASVAATYADERGWLRGHRRFVRVRSGGDFTVVLAEARYLPTYSSVCSTRYSCRVGRNVIINQDRWRWGSSFFPGPLQQYRRMVVNHETGHWLGRGHAFCPRPGAAAPVMQQQSKGMQGCRPNAWPLPREIAATRAS